MLCIITGFTILLNLLMLIVNQTDFIFKIHMTILTTYEIIQKLRNDHKSEEFIDGFIEINRYRNLVVHGVAYAKMIFRTLMKLKPHKCNNLLVK